MSQFPALTGKEIVKALRKTGFKVIRVKGSHHFLRHSDGRTTVIPIHAHEDIGSGLMGKILRDVGLTREELQNLLS